ncbi:MAG: inositol monophosphatase [Chloroflexota bacterium]
MTTTPFNFDQIQAWTREAGAIALSYYQTQLIRQQKSDYSPVTKADEAVEKFLIRKIQQSYDPRHYGFIGEESGGDWQGKEFIWAIDPIDGTRVFIDGLPLWCISIGLLRNGEPYRGLVYLPVLDEIYYTNDEGIAFWNDRPLAGMLRTDWDRDSFISVPSGIHRYFDIDFWRLRALGAVATHHIYVARGAAVAALHRQAKVWDLAGAHAILTAVGGTAVYLDGKPISLSEILAEGVSQQAILAGHPAVLDRLLPRIKPRQLAKAA